jgi:hypothetical protein
MLEFAGGFYGAHHVDEAWDRWGHDGGFVELSTRQLDLASCPPSTTSRWSSSASRWRLRTLQC